MISAANRGNGRQRRIRRKRKKKEIERIKHILAAYALRALVLLVMGIMIALMICGCLYIYEHVFEKRNVREVNAYYGALSHVEGKERETVGSTEGLYTVVLDPGHGGKDGGTEEGSATEKEINLAVALKMKELLEENSVYVILTRDRDTYIGLDERVRLANQEQGDLFVSLHCNYFDKDSSVRGLECYYAKDSESGKRYGERIIREMTERGSIVPRNAKPGNYHILRNAQVPAVLVEMGYLSNYEERKDLLSQEYQEKLAAELVNGILKGLEDA